MNYDKLPEGVKRGDIVDYETDDGGTVPMLVTHVNDQEGGDGGVTGTVFNIDGTSRGVTFHKGDEPQAPPPPPSLSSQFASLSPSEKAAFLADQGIQVSGQDAPPAPPANPETETGQTPPAPAAQDTAGTTQNGVSE